MESAENEMRIWRKADEEERNRRKLRKIKTSLKWKKVAKIVRVPICPKCKISTELELSDFTYLYRCPECNYIFSKNSYLN
jgi:predicted Zn-ribbon and HTH transcriptional regulator